MFTDYFEDIRHVLVGQIRGEVNVNENDSVSDLPLIIVQPFLLYSQRIVDDRIVVIFIFDL